MINFMAAMVRWQALSDLYRKKYGSPHLHTAASGKHEYTTNIALLCITLPLRYLLFALSPLP